MVLLRNNHHASNKMTSAMALVASRRTAFVDHGRRPENPQYPIKRRSMTAALTATFPHKRPRTSWGKPHANPAALRCSPFLIEEEAAASSTSTSEEDYFGGTVSSCSVVPSPCQSTSFVKTQPLQHLAIKLEDENYSDGPLHQVPTFLPVEHLLSTPISNFSNGFSQLSRCAQISPPLSSLTWPASPHSSSSPISPSGRGEFSSDDMLNWDHEFSEGSCGFLSERFCEIERDVNSIMGEASQHQAGKSAKPPTQQQEEVVMKDCRHDHNSTAITLEPKVEEGSECSQLSDMSCIASRRSADTATTVTTGECEEEYRIDLVDFEPEQCDAADVEGGSNKVEDSIGSCRTLMLTLNYDDVLRAWSDRGSFFIDGSWDCALPEVYALNLAAWEPENQDSQGFHDIFAGASKMISVAGPDDGTCVGEDGGGGFTVTRHARVLRYRQKRRTRLFSKKIRYEVRKLNAERRPRMKGRFIKRSMD